MVIQDETIEWITAGTSSWNNHYWGIKSIIHNLNTVTL